MPFLHEYRTDVNVSAISIAFVLAPADRQLARLDERGTPQLPTVADVHSWLGGAGEHLHLGRIDAQTCCLITLSDPPAEPPGGWAWHDARSLIGALSPDQTQAMACARQLDWWNRRHRFCGCCGTPTVACDRERARRCPQCGASFFPSASPAVIVAVTRGELLLLAHNQNFRSGMFSLLAGFVDPGETLEQAVAREVREEVGIEIGDVRYVTSQPWPFPNSLMAGFRAVHVSGEIQVDGREIAEAAWFSRDALPDVPRRGSVAHTLIDAWVRESAGG